MALPNQLTFHAKDRLQEVPEYCKRIGAQRVRHWTDFIQKSCFNVETLMVGVETL